MVYESLTVLQVHKKRKQIPMRISPETGPNVNPNLVSVPKPHTPKVVEFIDDLATVGLGDPNLRLLPSDPYQRAKARIKAEWCNRKLCSPYYQVLVRRSEDERRAAFDELVSSLREFSSELAGPYYFGSEVSIVDIALFPYASR